MTEKGQKTERVISTLVHVVIRQAGIVAFVGVLLAAIGGYFTALLYSNLRTSIEELLPSSAPSSVDLRRIGSRLKTVENLVILAFSADTRASKRFVTDLAERLGRLPRDVVAGVEYRVDREVSFFRKRAALFIDYDDLSALKDYTEKKLRHEKDVLGLGLTEDPVFDFAEFERKYADRMEWADRFPEGFYATKDQTCRLIVVLLPGRAGDVEAALRLKAAVDRVVGDLQPKSYAADLEVRYTGNTQNLLEEHAVIVHDIKLTSILVFTLVLSSLWLYFGSPWATAVLVFSAGVGTICSIGASYFFAGYLNANSAFLVSIVLGNGINFGIVLLARYLEERRRPRSHLRALIVSMKRTYQPTLTAALAAATAYGSLMLTDFRAMNQFGRIGFAGMILCWLSAFFLMPALLHLVYRRGYLTRIGRPAGHFAPMEWVASRLERNVGAVTAIGLGLTAAAVLAILLNRGERLETDMNRLRARSSVESGAGHYYHFISDIFGKNLSATVLLTETREETRRVASLLRERKRREGAESRISWVQTLDDLIPEDQPQKLALLADFRKLLGRATVVRLPEKLRNLARTVVDSEGVTPFSEADLSPLLLEKFTERDGRRGTLVLVDKPVVAQAEKEDALVTLAFVRSLREVAAEVNPNIAIAGHLPVGADMMTAIMDAGPKTTAFACAAVFLLIALLFRDPGTIILVTSALWIGVLWMCGIVWGMDIKINFLNFMALPITFGIGVDYGVNIFHRCRPADREDVLDSLRHTGGAVALCSLTTVIGYTSLVMAGSRAFTSFGVLAVIGEVCCAVAAIVFLPAYLLLRKRTKAETARHLATLSPVPAEP